MDQDEKKSIVTDFELGEYFQLIKDTKEYVQDIHKMVKLQNGRVRSNEINKADKTEVETIKKTMYIIVGIGVCISFVITPLMAVVITKLIS